jgi:hypothetical protein
MTTYMAIAKGEKAKSLRERRWVLQIDQALDTPIKMSSENSPKTVEKLVIQPQNKKEAKKDRRDVSLLLTSLVPRRRLLLLFFQSPDTFWRLAYITARCITRQPHGSCLLFPQRRSNCVCM